MVRALQASPTAAIEEHALVGHLRQSGMLSPQQAADAQRVAQSLTQPVAEVLRTLRLASDTDIARSLADLHRLPYWQPDASMVEPEVLSRVPFAFARQHRMLPVRSIGQVLHVAVDDPDDLDALFRRTQMQASRRRFGQVTCADIMSRDLVAVEFGTYLGEAWTLLRNHRIQALPVVDRGRRVIGLLGLEDFLRHVEADKGSRVGERVRHLLRPAPGSHSDKPEVVGQIMLTPQHGLQLARSDDSIAVAAEVLGQGDQAALPVVDEGGRLVGMLGAAGLNAVLFHHEALGHMRGDGTA